MDVAIVGLGMHPFGRTPSMSGLEQGAAAAGQHCDAGPTLSEWNLPLAAARTAECRLAGEFTGPHRASVHQRGKWLRDGGQLSERSLLRD